MKNYRIKILACILCSVPTFSALSHPHTSYNYVSAGMMSIDDENGLGKYKNYGGKVSVLITEQVFTTVAYSKAQDTLTFNGIELEPDFATFELGIGYRMPISHSSDWMLSLKVADINGSINVANQLYDFSDEAYEGAAGYLVRFNRVELGADIYYKKESETNATGLKAKFRYFFADHFSIDLIGNISDNANQIGLTVSYHF